MLPGSMIDLQSHSTVSDGQLEPAEVARSAAAAGVDVMALSDHDGVAGVAAATAAAHEAGIVNVPAVEMSCVHRYSEDLHICGYWIDTEAIAPACARAQSERVDRAKEIIANLNRHGVEVSFEDAVAKAGAADAIGRPHIAKAAGAGPDL
jgi:3',5'-nucleoside bisphosphate phosphatase